MESSICYRDADNFLCHITFCFSRIESFLWLYFLTADHVLLSVFDILHACILLTPQNNLCILGIRPVRIYPEYFIIINEQIVFCLILQVYRKVFSEHFIDDPDNLCGQFIQVSKIIRHIPDIQVAFSVKVI